MPVLDLFRLDGRVALVTGASRGLGRAMAVGLAEAGADIAGTSVRGCGETAAEVGALGRRFLPLTLDLEQATVAELQRIVERVAGEMGRLDILVNNAGIVRRAALLDYTEADWDAVLQVHLKAVFFLSQACAAIMAQQGRGKIIHIASMLSYQGGLRVPAYAAAKSGVAGLLRSMANEWAKLGINVNAIAPGYFDTDNTAALRADPERSAAILSRIPAGRWGAPEDLKGAVVFLASAASDYMHGSIVVVDGGWLAW
jgi:2-deoxy-D-gluconate 3-dehydrogenase